MSASAIPRGSTEILRKGCGATEDEKVDPEKGKKGGQGTTNEIHAIYGVHQTTAVDAGFRRPLQKVHHLLDLILTILGSSTPIRLFLNTKSVRLYYYPVKYSLTANRQPVARRGIFLRASLQIASGSYIRVYPRSKHAHVYVLMSGVGLVRG